MLCIESYLAALLFLYGMARSLKKDKHLKSTQLKVVALFHLYVI